MTESSPTSPATDRPVDTELFACYCARLLADNRCEQVVILDVRELSPLTDYLVLATGTSDRQVKSNVQDIEALAREQGQSIFRTDGAKGPASESSGTWAIIDCLDVMAHLFSTEARHYYDLESLWGDAPRIDWTSRTKPGQFAHLIKRPAQS